jgi:hypothetical protein
MKIYEQKDKLTISDERAELLKDIKNYTKNENGGPYFSVEFIVRNILHITEDDNKYCPVCYGNKIHPDEETFKPICECGWKGNYEDLLPKNEATNKKRTKLIDEML